MSNDKAILTSTLRDAPIFRGLETGLLNELCQTARAFRLAKGQRLFSQGDPATAFFVVCSGWIKIYRVTARGEEAIIGVFTKKDSFAEVAALGRDNYPAHASAVTDTVLAAFPIDRLLHRIAEEPQTALAMLAALARQMRRLVNEIEQMKGLSGIQRLSEFLTSQCDCEAGSCVVHLPFEKAVIAAKLGLKPETLSRLFHRMADYGVVIKGEKAEIRDIAVLRKIVDEDAAPTMAEQALAR